MEPIDVYLMYCAMKAHFSNRNYDFHKYGGKTKVSRDSFWKRNDKYFFVKLAKKHDDRDSIQDYLVSNFIRDRRGYIANFNDDTVSVLNGNQAISTLEVGWYPYGIAVDSRNGWVYVSNTNERTVSVLGYDD